jgi:hypothetical protein
MGANRGVVQPVSIEDPIDASGNVLTSVENTVDVNVLSGGQPSPVDETTNVTSTTITASGTTIIANVGAAEKCIVYQVYIASNDSFTPCVFDLRFTAGGTARYKTQLVSKGSRIPNVVTTPIKGGTGEDLYINLDVASSNLEVTVVWGTE